MQNTNIAFFLRATASTTSTTAGTTLAIHCIVYAAFATVDAAHPFLETRCTLRSLYMSVSV